VERVGITGEWEEDLALSAINLLPFAESAKGRKNDWPARTHKPLAVSALR